MTDPHVADPAIEDQLLRAGIRYSMNDAPFGGRGSLVNARLVGVFPTAVQTIEDRYGEPLVVNSDINGKAPRSSIPPRGPQLEGTGVEHR